MGGAGTDGGDTQRTQRCGPGRLRREKKPPGDLLCRDGSRKVQSKGKVSDLQNGRGTMTKKALS